MGCLAGMFKIIRHLVTKYIKSKNMSDFERSQETRRILLRGQNMPVVMALVFRKCVMYCFKSKYQRQEMSDMLLSGQEKVEMSVFNF